MLYMILGRDNPDSLTRRLEARPAHIQRLQLLRDQGRLYTAGPLPAVDSLDPGNAGFVGSLIIAEFESLNDAKTWADADPYVTASVYKNIEVHPYKRVFP